MSEEELQTVKDRLMPYMEKECGKHGIKMVSVSYTHLDVYKRQRINGPKEYNGVHFCLPISTRFKS